MEGVITPDNQETRQSYWEWSIAHQMQMEQSRGHEISDATVTLNIKNQMPKSFWTDCQYGSHTGLTSRHSSHTGHKVSDEPAAGGHASSDAAAIPI